MSPRRRLAWWALLGVAGWLLAQVAATQVDGGPHKKGSNPPGQLVVIPKP